MRGPIWSNRPKTGPGSISEPGVLNFLIPCLESAKYLGVMIDKQLTWNNHVNSVINKLAKAYRILSKVRHYVSKVVLRKLYYSFVYPYLKYGVIAWGNSRKTLLQNVQVARNQILRIINFKCLKDHVKISTLYKDMKILQVKDIFEIEVAKFMHSFHHGNLPCIFDSYNKSVATQHNHNTRSIANKNYYLQRMHSQSGQSASKLCWRDNLEQNSPSCQIAFKTPIL